ncbi:hypothetical protein [Actinoplanes flavus]|uniref:Uncharacterized protein n=1 Tax=Actinoplanes flavus TaxID=2820290 RepID=A0ABS3UTU2_9ACTN|nr:hypothetical protein [Actinoplanes flavus]MBO3741986.1 hypothetical protein [Actinoplanes flavus]
MAAFRVGDVVVTVDFDATQITPVSDEVSMERLIRAVHQRLVDWRQPVGGRRICTIFDLLAR